ncbi:hypothetical protein PTTG_02147 [Puccinia triticina 1-1 BBBD Race 1]|uniref:WD_REPEATS_REGION domain-containing protein n=2 Tax=Puccinia triticina TaxID=208348 RepID=A0A180GTJ9_PUCT1|nr:uncharacterized protein PtA15_5A225 [Puccinia triticina]OAV96126.1 hypothetical protein PTTG_02147 [Puccinia triticina 1-1 BBBD Race 1]WAQ84652.1 hypothetical protein PtA15_5A225 [Puccinia triticina]
MEATSSEPQPGRAEDSVGYRSYQIQFNPKDSLIREATTETVPSSFTKNLLRVAKWSSDGSTVLTEAEDRSIRLFNGVNSDPHVDDDGNPHRSSWRPTRNFPMADALLSTCWFPYSSSTDPSRYCFVAAVKDHPIHLLDASDGRIRASYPIVDHRERMVAPHSMLFSDDGTTLFAGYESAIEIFDVSRSGEAGERYKTISSRKSKDGQKGIISALALDPSQQGLLAAGSYSGQIALHDTKSSEIAPALVFNTTETTGVTQVKFHPQNDQVMFSASRKSNQILCWDLRYGATTFHSFNRPGRTNQKIQFDTDWAGTNLITGATDGKIRFYSLMDVNQPAQEFQIHSDTIGSASFNPTASTSIVTCAGSRRPSVNLSTSPPTSPSSLSSTNPHPAQEISSSVHHPKITELKLWKFSYL